jgi:hypothetical protein
LAIFYAAFSKLGSKQQDHSSDVRTRVAVAISRYPSADQCGKPLRKDSDAMSLAVAQPEWNTTRSLLLLASKSDGQQSSYKAHFT